MRGYRLAPVAVVGLGSLALLGLWNSPAAAQTKAYGGRLSPVPITVAMQDAVAGRGSVTAVLTDNRLSLEGTFDGLRSPATVARLHVAPRGIRGPAVADIMVPGATSGTFKAVVLLSESQRQALEKNSLYLQIHSEKAPEGNLWGWFFPQEVKR
jgi:CHRD domain